MRTVSYVAFAPIDLKKADIFIRDGFDNTTNTPLTSAVEPIGESTILLTNMNTIVPDPATTVGVSVKFGSDETEYTVTSRSLGAGTNEVQTIEIDDDVSGGTFTLTYGTQTTGTLAHNASAAVVEAALEALSSLGLGTATVTGASPIWTVTFTGDMAATNATLIVGDGALLTGGVVTDIQLTETVAGVDAVAEQQDALVGGTWTGGTFTLTTPAAMGAETTGLIDWDADASEVEMALEALDGIAVGECTVSAIVPLAGGAGNLHFTFSGALAGPQDELTANVGSITPDGTLPIIEDVAGVAAVAEVWTVGINDSTTGGTFTLTHTTESAPILWNATAADVETAFEGIASISDVSVSGGSGPFTDWVITWVTPGADAVNVTGDGTNLTGGDTLGVSVVEVTPGVSATSTASIVVTPILVAATTIGGSVTFGGRKLEVKVGDGTFNYNEAQAREYLLNRGSIDTVRDGDDTPMEVSFEFVWEYITAVTASAVPTLEDVLKQNGEASTWVSTSSDLCEPYCVDLEINYDPGCGGENTETIVCPYFRYESLDHNLKDSQISCSGKCNATEAIATRGA